MKKKLFGYLTLAFAIVSIALVGSCRDYDEDVYRVKQELKDSDSDLYDTIIKRYNWAIDSVKDLRNATNAKFAAVNQTLNSLDSTIKANDSIYRAKDSIQDKVIDSLITATYSADSAAKVRIDSVASALQVLNQKDSAMQHLIDSLKLLSHHDPYTYNDSALKAKDSIMQHVIDSLKLLSHDPYNDSLLLKHDSILFDSVYKYHNYFLRIDSTLNDIKDTLDSVMTLVDTLAARVERMEKKIEELVNIEQKRITSLYVQGALNPTFGYFALPGGIKNNILMGYYGKATAVTGTYRFPADDSDNSACVDAAMALTSTELGRLAGIQPITIIGGKAIPQNSSSASIPDTVNLGKLYLTINPNEVELDTTYKFSLVNSLGQESKAKLDSLKPCEDKLQFGFTTRASGSNPGFYEANVYVLADEADSLKPEISVDKEQLKSIVQKLRNRQLDLSGIAGAVFDLFQTKLDAYAVKTTWTDTLNNQLRTNTITSYYDVAATVVNPLSYNAMNGMGAGASIPTISQITELTTLIDPSAFIMPDLGDIVIDDRHIVITDITFSPFGEILVTINGNPGTINIDNLAAILNTQYASSGYSASITSQVNAVIDTIQARVNRLMDSMEGVMESSVDGMITNMNTQVVDKFNPYIRRMNAVIGKINSLTSRINSVLNLGAGAFLQPLLAYEGADNSMHPMSTDINHPSVFNSASGNNITLYPTSYSAELLAPAYKKFIAVVNAWDSTDGSRATVPSAISAANVGDMNEVIDGGLYGINFVGQAGYTYEIYYSGIDYDGYISAKRFYVTVK